MRGGSPPPIARTGTIARSRAAAKPSGVGLFLGGVGRIQPLDSDFTDRFIQHAPMLRRFAKADSSPIGPELSGRNGSQETI